MPAISCHVVSCLELEPRLELLGLKGKVNARREP